MQNWAQSYDPLGSPLVSTLVAAIPVGVLLGAIASGRIKAHIAALLGLAAALLISITVVGMPTSAALAAAGMGAAFGLLPIGWIVFNTIFLYQITKEQGAFDRMQAVITTISTDRRVQLVLIAFALGSFFEGAAGFGTPVAITGAILLGLGFSPLEAATMSLIANTAPVAFGSMGTPIIALSGVTGIDQNILSKMVGRQLPFFSVIVPFWLMWAYGGMKSVRAIWPTLLVSGVSFAVPQWLMSNLHGPTLVDVVSGACCVVCTALFAHSREPRAENRQPVTRADLKAWLPWAIMSVLVFIGGFAAVKAKLNGLFAPRIPVPFLDGVIQRVPPVVAAAAPEPAIYTFNILSATGSWMLVAAVIGGLVMGVRPLQLVRLYGRTLAITWASLLTIVAMMAIGYVTRYSGLDAILGLAFAKTGVLYPLFGTLLGWLGVALTGSDTSSNVLFGSLQKITSEQLGLSPVLMTAANSSGGVMGKMIDAQSIVVASTATRYYGHEGKILRFVFMHSIVLALLVALLVLLQAYVPPFTSMVPPMP